MPRDMTPTPGQQEPTLVATAAAEAQLAQLSSDVVAMQGLLVRLLQEIVQAEARLGPDYAGQLVEANEQLVLASLASRADAADAEQALEALVRRSALDGLTQLPTRATLQAHFDQAVVVARGRGTRFALLFMDLSNFKPLNDQYGHAFGDRVLAQIARRLQATVAGPDTVSRHGGDEFLILLARPGQPGSAHAVAGRLVAAIAAPITVDGETVVVTASVGIAIYPDDGESLDTLVSRADDAMYAAKRLAPAGPVSDTADMERQLADLREANERLLVAALSAEEMRAAAEQVRQRQTAFLAMVADELRNPAAPIRIAGAMLGRTPAVAPLLPRVQSMVERQLGQMSRLLGNLVDAATVDPGSLQCAHGRVDVRRVIDAAVASIRPAMERRRQEFTLHAPPEDPAPVGPTTGAGVSGTLAVQGDVARLEQVVSNLLDNASKFTPDEGSISLSVTTSGDTLAVTVADDGIGITPAILPHVFEPFVQDAQALGFNGVGLGIGLTVARKLARAHGGDVVGYSAGSRRGSRFVLTLPLAGRRQIAGKSGTGTIGTGGGGDPGAAP